MAQVYVGNLNTRISEKTIEDEFRPFSSVQSVKITRKSPNYAFVDFDDREDALQAIHKLDGIHGWKVKLSYYPKGGGGGGGGGVSGRRRGGGGHFLRGDCTIVTPSQKIDVSSSKSFGKNKSNPGDEHEAGRVWRIRENKAYGDEDRRKIDVNEVPISQQCNQDNVGSKPVSIFEPEKPSFDELVAQKLMEKIEEKVREFGAVCEENESLKHQLNEANLELSSAKANKEEMTLKLEKLGEELEQTKNHVTFTKVKGEDMSLMLKNLRAELAKSKYNLSSAKSKELEMSLKLKKVQEELEKVKSNASSAKNKREEMSLKLMKLEEELGKSEKNAVQLNAKLKEVEGAKETLQAEMKNINEKTEEWRKTADAAAAIFAVGVEINTEISESETPILCYIDRAATQMSLGRVREALWYCRIAATLDSNFLEVHLTSANCHLKLGEIKDALYYYNKCLQSGASFCSDRRVSIEAADGEQKAQKVVSSIKHSSELLLQRTFSAATKALGVIGEALLISSFSEKLLEMKGEALFVLRKYEEVVQLCEITLDFAEKNFATVAIVDGKNLSKTWRWNLMSKSYFHLGRLEIALNFIEKQVNLRSTEDRTEESMSPLAATMRELLRCKNAGNEAFRSRRYTEAVKHYTNAMSRSTESCPFSAVCLSNRAAAYQALGEIIDAIADCSLALALDGSYQKALARRATLHEMIRDYEKAASDLKRLISLFEKQSSGRQTGSNGEDVKQARRRLSYIEEKAKRGLTRNHYLILGVNASDSTSEIKKAYHKAALRHHPDKAGQFLARSDSGYDGQPWKEIRETIFMDADGLFKIIGMAYSVLSDSRMRSKYDYEEKMRDDEDDEEVQV